MLKLAIIGDIHNCWDEDDLVYFNQSDYDAILFVGDLPGRLHTTTISVAKSMAKIRKRALYMPGNHDAVTTMQLIAEIRRGPKLIERLSKHHEKQCAELREALGNIEYCGYSKHTIESSDTKVDVVAGRPHSMGGPYLGYAPYLRRQFAVESIEDSGEKLKRIVDSCDHSILFFAHNGPTGLGEKRDDIWGCDFSSTEGDFGDADLEMAMMHASSSKNNLGVVAGHMHQTLRGGGFRKWFVQREDSVYINAARVPRIFKDQGEKLHHHVALHIQNQKKKDDTLGVTIKENQQAVEVAEVFVSKGPTEFQERRVALT